jgi:hypothetical protein
MSNIAKQLRQRDQEEALAQLEKLKTVARKYPVS